MIGRLGLSILLVLVVLTTLVLLPFHIFCLKLLPQHAGKLPIVWHKIICWLIGIRVIKSGGLTKQRPLLVVANHVSWSDIIVLGSLGELSFIAKSEVDEIPGANWLARLQRTIFVVRENRHKSGQQAQEVTQRLLAGDPIVLFSEGTTGSGNRLLPFNSSLLGSAQYALQHGDLEHVFIQPVSICYTKLHGLPLGRRGRSVVSWEGDEDLMPHLSRFVRSGRWDVEVRFGEPLEFKPDMKRKAVNIEIQKRVSKMLATSLSVNGGETWKEK